jgi:DNA-binding winged helix-turn-helix (wHTH) protein
VEEGNLSQNIFVLRKILGDDRNGHSFIKTIPRRGYQFIAPVRQVEASGVDDILRGSAAARVAMEYWGRRGPARGLRIFERAAGGGGRRTG